MIVWGQDKVGDGPRSKGAVLGSSSLVVGQLCILVAGVVMGV